MRQMLCAGRLSISIGRTGEVAALVRSHPRKANQLIECLWDTDLGIASRAADALEEITRDIPSILAPWKEPLIGLMSEVIHNKLRWSLALIVPRCRLSHLQRETVAEILETYLTDPSSIVKTCALQGMADLTVQDAALLPSVIDQIRIHSRSGTPAMRARGRKLLLHLEEQQNAAIAEVFGFRTLRKS
jgi:hypothetical protein